MADGGSTTELAPGIVLHDNALDWSFARGGGPGGQHVNKTSTKATLTVLIEDLADQMPPWAVGRLLDLAGQKLAKDPDRIQISSSDSRSQSANRDDCLQKLRDLLVQAMHRPKRRKKTRPSRGAKERRLKAKKEKGERKAARSKEWG